MDSNQFPQNPAQSGLLVDTLESVCALLSVLSCAAEGAVNSGSERVEHGFLLVIRWATKAIEYEIARHNSLKNPLQPDTGSTREVSDEQ